MLGLVLILLDFDVLALKLSGERRRPHIQIFDIYKSQITLSSLISLILSSTQKYMQFPKENKKYYWNELQHDISNYFTFTMKDLNRALRHIEKSEIQATCHNCNNFLTTKLCQVCKHPSELPAEVKLNQNFLVKSKMMGQEGSSGQELVIICVDLSGSMGINFQSEYNKVNEDLVSRELGESIYQKLKNKLGAEKVIKNSECIKMMLGSGFSFKEIIEQIQSLERPQFQSKGQGKDEKEEKKEYISRKEIVSVAISKYISILKSRNPKTLVTIVYFNDCIEVPILEFKEKHVIAGIETKTIEEMMEIGANQAEFMSIMPVAEIGEALLTNLTYSKENGQTALTPTLAFCFGMAQKLKYSLHQIIVVTDGESNIGFGRTEGDLPPLQLEETKCLFHKLALQYAKPLNCVVNVITFEDCVISYDILDQLIGVTGGLPCQITFEEKGGEKIVTESTINEVQFEIIESFIEYPKQFCHNVKIIIACSRSEVKLKVNPSLEPFLIDHPDSNSIILKPGIKSMNEEFKVEFIVPKEQEEFEATLRFTIICEFQKKNSKTISVRTDKIVVLKGSEEKAEKQETKIMINELREKLQNREFFEEDMQEYESLEKKIEQNEKLKEGIGSELIEKFRMKKEKLEVENLSMKKLEREKMSMKSRTHKTYKEKDLGSDDDYEEF